MFLRKAALRPVPRYAVVDEQAMGALEQTLEEEEEGLQQALDSAYHELDRRQPVLAQWLAEQVADRSDEMAQSLGYFLAVTVYLVFREAFPTRLGEVDAGGLHIALETLAADEELRANDPTEIFNSDDVVAMGQPVVLGYVQHHLEEALQQAGDDADVAELDLVYRAILVEVIALTHAVTAPAGQQNARDEVLA